MSELKPIGPSLAALIVSSPECNNSISPSDAASAARTLFGCFRKGDANDPETYAAAVAAVLSMYSPDVVRRVTDPRTGLAGRSKWLPTVSEVREACEEIIKGEAAARKREADLKAQLERRAEMPRECRPTYDELLAKHGKGWGLKEAEKDQEAEAKRLDQLRKANDIAFQRVCEAGGVDPSKGVSPSLIAAIHKREHVA